MIAPKNLSLTIHTDGGARGNPGPAAIGFVIKDKTKIIAKEKKYIGNTTNNVAEYQAVLEALGWLKKDLSGPKPLSSRQISCIFYLDSALVVNQLSGHFKIKTPHLLPYATQIHHAVKELGLACQFVYIPRTKNQEADALVNQALDAQTKR